MVTWEYVVAIVAGSCVWELKGPMSGLPTDPIPWEDFLSKHLQDGWQLVLSESALRPGCPDQYYTLKRRDDRDLPSQNGEVHPGDRETLLVQLEVTTSCG